MISTHWEETDKKARMTSLIGNKRGLSFIELMIAVSLLSMGTTVIHQTYLTSVSALFNYSNKLKINLWMDEKLWEIRESLIYSSDAELDEYAGVFEKMGRKFEWSVDSQSLARSDLYKIQLSVNWREGNKPRNITRQIYAFKKILL